MSQEREPLSDWLDPGRTALLVIDVQNDFCHPEGGFAKRGYDLSTIQEMVPRLLRLIEEAREASVPVVFLRVARGRETEWPALDRLNRLRFGEDYPRVAVEGTWGAEFYEGIKAEPGEPVITKHRYGAFTGTDLEILLGSLGAKTLILTGVATNVCVESTAREGFMLDYDIVVVSDCCATVGRELHEGTLENIRLNFGRVASADEVVVAWAAAVASPQAKGGQGGTR